MRRRRRRLGLRLSRTTLRPPEPCTTRRLRGTSSSCRLDSLPVGTGVLAGAVCWYSIVYTPPEELGRNLAEPARVLKPGGYLLLAFQAGSDEPVHVTDAHGTTLSLTSYRHSLGDVTRELGHTGFAMYATALREPELEHERTPQSFVIARKPS